jgi:hypothetical protein
MSTTKQAKSYARVLRTEIIEAYGAKCACCGESRFHFLGIDHKNNDGAQHLEALRKSGKGKWKSVHGIRRSGPIPFWNDLKRRGFPKDNYQCLCYNCNLGRHRNWDYPGICPHEIERGLIVSRPLNIKPEVLAEPQMDLIPA